MSQKKFSGAPFGVQTSRCVPGFVRFCGASDLLTGIEPIAKLNCLYLKLVVNLFYVQVSNLFHMRWKPAISSSEIQAFSKRFVVSAS